MSNISSLFLNKPIESSVNQQQIALLYLELIKELPNNSLLLNNFLEFVKSYERMLKEKQNDKIN